MTDGQSLRVLVVDDSAFARKVLRQALEKHPSITVVGIAGDGLEALEKIAELKPDVVTLDLVMPNLDGVGVLRELASAGSDVRVVLVSMSDHDSEIVVQALQLGAVGIVRKPTALATDRLYELSDELVQAVVDAGFARFLGVPRARPPSTRPPPRKAQGARFRAVVIGVSTGGPQALTCLLAGFPKDFAVPIAIALHIPGDYTEALAKRLDDISPLHVVEAKDGMLVSGGTVVIAKGGMHLKIRERAGAMHLSLEEDTDGPYSPSIDRLFETASKAYGSGTLGVVLTGMGDDGLRGAGAIVRAGGQVITQSESSCVIYGMPRCVAQAGLSVGQYSIEDMADEIVQRV